MGDFQRCFDPHWGQFRSRWHPVPGNHDYMTASASAYFDYFGAAAGGDRSGYYVRSFGDWLVLMLDSNVPSQRNSPQWEFVRRELELHRRPCTLAVWHHPLFTSGQNGPSVHMRDLFALLEAGGADVVINAHDHLYERFASQTADGRPSERGIRQFIVGTGGADLYRFVTTAPNSEARIAQFGILRLSLQPTAYRWEFVLAAGGLGDSGNDVCH
jgi:3',5'-cyclic AMP phosphodiesterase CpdA